MAMYGLAARKLVKTMPVARLLLIGEFALMTRRHLRMLDADERRRLGSLVWGAARRPGSLSRSEAEELRLLIAKLEPRLLLGGAIRRVSPVPIPGRLLYGSRKRPPEAAGTHDATASGSGSER
jgi:hypothetical protein